MSSSNHDARGIAEQEENIAAINSCSPEELEKLEAILIIIKGECFKNSFPDKNEQRFLPVTKFKEILGGFFENKKDIDKFTERYVNTDALTTPSFPLKSVIAPLAELAWTLKMICISCPFQVETLSGMVFKYMKRYFYSPKILQCDTHECRTCASRAYKMALCVDSTGTSHFPTGTLSNTYACPVEDIPMEVGEGEFLASRVNPKTKELSFRLEAPTHISMKCDGPSQKRGPRTAQDQLLKLFAAQPHVFFLMIAQMRMIIDINTDVVGKNPTMSDRKLAEIARRFYDARMDVTTRGISTKSQAEVTDELGKTQGIVSMSWDGKPDMDIHVFYKAPSGSIVHISYCKKQYEGIVLRYDHQSGPATELVTFDPGQMRDGRFMVVAHWYSGSSGGQSVPVTVEIKFPGCKTEIRKVVFPANKSDSAYYFDFTNDIPEHQYYRSIKDCEYDINHKLETGCGLCLPRPFDLEEKHCSMLSPAEQEKRDEIKESLGLGSSKVVFGEIAETLPKIWEKGVGQCHPDCPIGIKETPNITVSANDPAVQPTLYGYITTSEPTPKQFKQVIVTDCGDTRLIDGKTSRPQPVAGDRGATKGGCFPGDDGFNKFTKGPPTALVIDVIAIYLLPCGSYFVKVGEAHEGINAPKFQNVPLAASWFPKESADKTMRHAITSISLPGEIEVGATIGFIVQPEWKVYPIINEQEASITPWYETPSADTVWKDAIEKSKFYIELMEKFGVVASCERTEAALALLPKKYKELFAIRKSQLAGTSSPDPRNKAEVRRFAEAICEEKDPNLEKCFGDNEVIKTLFKDFVKGPYTESNMSDFVKSFVRHVQMKAYEEDLEKKRLEKEVKDLARQQREAEEAKQDQRRMEAAIASQVEARVQQTLVDFEDKRDESSSSSTQKCPICIDKPPNRVFKCGHVMCNECIPLFFGGRPSKECHICRVIVSVAEIGPIFM